MFKNSVKRLKEPLTITTIAMMSALYVVLYMAKIQLGTDSRVSLTFLPVIAGGYLVGPVGAMIVGALGDISGSLFFPMGAYFPGFTLSAMVNGLIYGLFLYKTKKFTVVKVFVSTLVAILTVNILLNTVWISILYENTFIVYLYKQLIKNIIVYPVQAFLSVFVIKLLSSTEIDKKYI